MNIRILKAVSDDDVAQAVITARAVVALDERLDRAKQELTRRDEQIASLRRSQQSASEERNRLLNRIFAVDNLHSEATRAICGDGCCHEELGTCSYCNEPYPCRTIQALADRDDEEPSDTP